MITLRDIIDDYQLDKKEVAKRFFPDAKYPDLALARIMDYSKELSLSQVCVLANMANCQSADLVNTLLTNL